MKAIVLKDVMVKGVQFFPSDKPQSLPLDRVQFKRLSKLEYLALPDKPKPDKPKPDKAKPAKKAPAKKAKAK